jgi:hypothetical protein
MFWFYIPFVYLIHSRLKTKFQLISWQIIFIIPQLLITYHFLEIRSNIFIHFFLISQIIFFSIYEIGYIENDIVTTRKEKNPTIRLNRINTKYVIKNYSRLIFIRYYIVLCLVFLLFFLDKISSYDLNLYTFVGSLLLTRLIFSLHNHIRNRFNILTFFLLSFLKYSFPIVLFIQFDNMTSPLLLSLMIFPILRTIELLTLKRFNFKNLSKLIGNIDIFRIVYYISCLLLLFILKFFINIDNLNFYISITIISYFILFRVSCFFIVKYGLYKRNQKR